MLTHPPSLRMFFLVLIAALPCGASATLAQDIEIRTGVRIARPPATPARRPPARMAQGRRTVRPPVPTPEAATLANEALDLGHALRTGTPPRLTEAERAYRIAARLDPQDARPHAWLGDVEFERQRWPQAEAALRRAIQLDPADAISYVRLSYMYSRLGRFPEAETAANQVKRLQPNVFYGYCSMGWSKFRSGDFNEAEIEYRRAIQLAPDNSGLRSDLGLILLRLGRWSDAAEALRRAVELDPNNALATINYGVALQYLGRLDEAAQQYERAGTLNARAPQPRSNLGMIHYLRGDTQRARAAWEEAARLESNYALNRIGQLLLDNRWTEARAELERFTQASETNADGWLLLADAQNALGDSAAARSAHERAARLAPDYARLPRPRPR